MTEERTFAPDDTTEDALLDGRVRLRQPRRGYRAATDPVLLAAACPARPGEAALDLGCGAGAASLCLAARIEGLALHGLEVQPRYAALARANGAGRLTVHEGDLRAMPAALRALSFDQVIANPPYFDASSPASPDAGRDRANREEASVGEWIEAGLRRLKPGGRLTLIHRAERLGAILAALEGGAGDARVLPVAPRQGRAAGRVIVRARKGARAPLRLLAPLVMHAGAAHIRDEDDFSAPALAVLRDAQALDLDAG
ncbi:MAG: methyltransferase [Pseudomonadota bacterium]